MNEIHNNHWDSKGERPYSFDFLPIAMTDQLQQKELLQFQLDYGLIARHEAIGQIRHVNNLQAKSIVKEIDKEQENDMKRLGDNNGSVEQRNLKDNSKTSTSGVKITTSKN